MATNLDGDETCRHGFTGLPEDCVRCAREAHQAAIEAARQDGYREGVEALVEEYLADGRAGIRTIASRILDRALIPPSGGGEGERRHPQWHEAMNECLRTIRYHRAAPLWSTAPDDDPRKQAYMHALERVENTIKAEIENGGPLTSSLMGARLRQGEGK